MTARPKKRREPAGFAPPLNTEPSRLYQLALAFQALLDERLNRVVPREINGRILQDWLAEAGRLLALYQRTGNAAHVAAFFLHVEGIRRRITRNSVAQF